MLANKRGSEGADVPPSPPTTSASPDDDASPRDKFEAAYREIQDQLANELLDSILRMSPESFEQLVVDLLVRMGYGKGDVTGGSGDGGIDGIIYQDALGLEKIYLQAKRWQDQAINSKEINGFSGSLDSKGAQKGVFVTTSRFNENAERTAKDISKGNKTIRLIDGQELAKLMIEYEMGVNTQYTRKIQQINESYFEDELYSSSNNSTYSKTP